MQNDHTLGAPKRITTDTGHDTALAGVGDGAVDRTGAPGVRTGSAHPGSERERHSRRPLEAAIFVVLATLLCFGAAAPAIFGALPDEMIGVLVPAAQLTPFLAALVMFAVVRPGGFFRQFALGWGRSWRAIGLGIAVVAVAGLAQLAAGVLTGFEFAALDAILLAFVAVPVFWVLQGIFAIGEELGWRGWLISRLRGFGFWTIAMLSAIAWMVWHLPAIPLIVGDGGFEVGLAYLLAIGSWAPFMVALRLLSGSVWPAIIVHGALNSVRVFLTQSIASGGGVNWVVEAVGWVLWLGAAALVWHFALRRPSAPRP
ncbi:type II CAAX endopeptidase family protein [uncultured Agrococcus sp.]|uniref:type II CAAX endopeptidase family protein n=1 Tax=uncultured Agrococcus sp. TaxID=382258 RepID=UPI0025DC7F23|nr:type II CAAX endopeptidase family protein [uncultured Agrococcus sp.]